MTNTTTALGFATFIFTESDILREFGVVAAINILAVFFISIFTIPAIFSFLPAPKRRHVRHLDRKWVFWWSTNWSTWWKARVPGVRHHYRSTGLEHLRHHPDASHRKHRGRFAFGRPRNSRLGVVRGRIQRGHAFEVLINTHRPNYVTRDNFLRRVEKMQKMLAQYPYFSRSLSLVDASKFAKQAYYNGNPAKYALIRGNEKASLAPTSRTNMRPAEWRTPSGFRAQHHLV